MKLRVIFLFFISLLLAQSSYSQQSEPNDVIQFSGVVLEANNLNPVPFTQIYLQNHQRTIIADASGFFSFATHKKDSIIFNCLGFERAAFMIPDTLTSNRYSFIQLMISDTLLAIETVIYPWPTIEQFKEAFLKIKIPDDDLERAKKNLALAEMKERVMAYKMDGSMNYKNYIDKMTSKLYYAGQYPPNNLLNPFAWAKFIEAWRRGDFKRKD